MKRFIKDLKRYYAYTRYSARSDLKDEVASSYLNWLWWVLDPLFFMLVYTFIALVVFRKGQPYFPIFVFIGLTLWNFYEKCVLQSVKIIRSNAAIVTKVYLPKHMLIVNRLMVNGFKMMVSFVLIIIMMIIYRVPVTVNIIYIIPILIDLVIVTFGISCWMLHFGVFIDDLYNVMKVVLRLMFYMSGIFYAIDGRIPEPWNSLILELNPISMLIQSARLSLIYSGAPYRKLMIVWGLISILLSVTGIHTIYKYENTYVKVM